MIKILVVCGPTASGKTAVAARLAKELGGEVVSADSMQVYKYMDIGTAKPSEEEKLGVPHHLIGFLEPDESFSVADYTRLAEETIQGIVERGKLPIIAGGTGLYISSLLSGTKFEEMRQDPAIREELEALAREKGGEFLLEALAEIDPELAGTLHPNDKGRIIRAIEVYRLTGVTMTELRKRSRAEPSRYDALIFGLGFSDRSKLYRRIDMRVDQMLLAGLEDEARSLYGKYSKTAAQAIGYKEFAAFFSGEATLEETTEKIKMETRRYAKRQLTWFRRESGVRWFDMGEPDNIERILECAREAFPHGKEDTKP